LHDFNQGVYRALIMLTHPHRQLLRSSRARTRKRTQAIDGY